LKKARGFRSRPRTRRRLSLPTSSFTKSPGAAIASARPAHSHRREKIRSCSRAKIASDV
jgi:hypothetical protein